MPSKYEEFWSFDRFAVVGHSGRRNFPLLTYRGLKQLGKTVFPVDPSVGEIDGDPALDALAALPAPVDAAVLEVPRDETLDRVLDAADAGIRDLWIHMNTDSPEALRFAAERGLRVRSGNCAVMYLTPGFTYHSLHKWVNKLAGRY